MTGRQAYKLFLQSDFWQNLSAEKRRQVPACEECKSSEYLQCHHTFYRSDWYQTQLADLKVLCRSCHKRQHGLSPLLKAYRGMFIYRDDIQFSRFLYWTHSMREQMYRTGRKLQPSRLWYLKQAVKMYRPKKKDTAMQFHVDQTLKTNAVCHTFSQ